MTTASGLPGRLLGRLWRKARRWQWRLAWLSNAKFICGVCGVVRTGDGRVLLSSSCCPDPTPARSWVDDTAIDRPAGAYSVTE